MNRNGNLLRPLGDVFLFHALNRPTGTRYIRSQMCRRLGWMCHLGLAYVLGGASPATASIIPRKNFDAALRANNSPTEGTVWRYELLILLISFYRPDLGAFVPRRVIIFELVRLWTAAKGWDWLQGLDLSPAGHRMASVVNSGKRLGRPSRPIFGINFILTAGGRQIYTSGCPLRYGSHPCPLLWPSSAICC